MEAIVEDLGDTFLDMTPNYDTTTQTFVQGSVVTSSTTLSAQNTSCYVRYVEKKLPAAHPKGRVGGGAFRLNSNNEPEELHDTFSGIIDGITGELLHGSRHYVLTKEDYEGPFYMGMRHGNDAIVKNIFLPPPIHHLEPKFLKDDDSVHSFEHYERSMIASGAMRPEGAKYIGTYSNDYPLHGTLVLPSYTYHGPFVSVRPHGQNGTLVKPTGYKYEGEFKYGVFHGMGCEREEGGGIYKGEFCNGVRQGRGTYTTLFRNKDSDGFLDSDLDDILADNREKDEKKDFSITSVYHPTFSNNTKKDYYVGEDCDSTASVTDTTLSSLISDTDSLVSTSAVSVLSESERTAKQKHPKKYTYDGQWHASMRQGEGTEKLPNGEVYRGQFHANLRHGYGTITFPHPNNLVAEGMWRAGLPLNGTYGWALNYPNGDKYTGFAKEFMPNGYGVKRFENGDLYCGEWRMGKRNGEGIFITGKGREEFIGQWEDDQIIPQSDEKKSNLIEVTKTLLGDSYISSELSRSGGGGLGTTDSFDLEKMNLLNVTEDGVDWIEKETLDYESHTRLLEIFVQKSLNSSMDCLEKVEYEFNQRNPSYSDNVINNDLSTYPTPGQLSKKLSSKHHNAGLQENKYSDTNKDNDEELHKPLIMNYPNGDSYLGYINPETLHREGHGMYVAAASGSTFSGEFHCDKRHGYGILIHAQYGKYAGNFLDDKKHGMGTLILNDASSYHGNFEDGYFHGRGTLCERNGNVYVGDWWAGLRHGDGMETLADGRLYLGEYKDGKRHGVGTLLTKAGGQVTYSGAWNEGRFHGEGVFVQRLVKDPVDVSRDPQVEEESMRTVRTRDSTSDDVIMYEGSFIRGQRHGFGTLTNDENGMIYKGHWHQGFPGSGKWRIRYSDGSVFSGQATAHDDTLYEIPALDSDDIPPMKINFSIIEPKPDGFGTMKYANGDLYVGDFSDGKREGNGSCIFANGDKWEGDWSNDALDANGNGTLTLVDGTVHRFQKKTSNKRRQ